MQIIKPQKRHNLKNPPNMWFSNNSWKLSLLESRKYFFRPFIEIEKSFIITWQKCHLMHYLQLTCMQLNWNCVQFHITLTCIFSIPMVWSFNTHTYMYIHIYIYMQTVHLTEWNCIYKVVIYLLDLFCCEKTNDYFYQSHLT